MRNDEAYANAAHIPGGAEYPDRWAIAAREWRELEAALGRARLNQPYGPDPREKFDLFYPAGRPLGLVVLIHGGYWLSFGREDFSHLSKGVTARGWACALPSYPLAPAARISAITRSLARATSAAAARIAGPIAVTGHSAGGHLAARLICTDIALPELTRISACVPVSPLGDLAPLLGTSMNVELQLDAAEAERESPVHANPQPGVPVHIFAGAQERPAFLAQARQLAGAWPGSGLTLRPARHHFDIIEDYEDPDSALIAALTRG